MIQVRIGGLQNAEDDILAEATCLSDERSARKAEGCREENRGLPATAACERLTRDSGAGHIDIGRLRCLDIASPRHFRRDRPSTVVLNYRLPPIGR